MKIVKSIGIVFAVTAILQACGNSEPSTKLERSLVPKEVHNIQPNEVPNYIESFKAQNAKVNFQYDGQQYDIALSDFVQGAPAIIAEFERGLVVFGFNFDKNEPVASLSIIEKIDGDQIESHAYDITVTTDGDNFIYDGMIEHKISKGLFGARLVINESFFGAGNSQVNVVDSNTATVNGTLGARTYIQISDLINNHPSIDTLLLQSIDGSMNDDINMHTGRLIRNAQLTTVVPSNGNINSGGVDLFAAGFKREYHYLGMIGVHSWCCEAGKSAHLLPKDDPAHGAQLTYFREMLGTELGPEFYFFTINAAPAESIYTMSDAEVEKYLVPK